jgi:hypothetical protein
MKRIKRTILFAVANALFWSVVVLIILAQSAEGQVVCHPSEATSTRVWYKAAGDNTSVLMVAVCDAGRSAVWKISWFEGHDQPHLWEWYEIQKFRQQLYEFAAAAMSPEEERSRIEILLRAVYERAIEGDMQAAKVLLDRLIPATLQADINVSGMTAVQALGVFEIMAEEYSKAGRLPELPDRT